MPLAARREARLEHQLGQLTAVERQFEHLLVGDDLADARVARLDERGAALHGHRFFELTELERDARASDSRRPAARCRSARTSGIPGAPLRTGTDQPGRFCSTYDPVSSVTAVRVSAVSVLRDGDGDARQRRDPPGP